jgi:hypothetical protein
MGTHEIQIVTGEKTPFSTARRLEKRPAPFVVQWRALQHQFKSTQLHSLSTGISRILAIPRRKSIGAQATFRNFSVSNLIAP